MNEHTSVCPSCGHIEYSQIGLFGTRAHFHCRLCGQWWGEDVSTGTQRVSPDAGDCHGL